MRALNTSDYSRMRAVQSDSMADIVDITNRTPYNNNGDVAYSGVVQSGVACGFDFQTNVRLDSGEIIKTFDEADIRLDLDVQIGINDLVTLISLAGEAHSEVYEVFGNPQYGTSVKHVPLKRIGN
jgi:hypothetical protein